MNCNIGHFVRNFKERWERSSQAALLRPCGARDSISGSHLAEHGRGRNGMMTFRTTSDVEVGILGVEPGAS